MTPEARLQTASELLDQVLAGVPAEKALTMWARSSRYAGSKDRAAVRDIVFDCLRRKRSYAALGGAETGRGLVIGSLRAADVPLDAALCGGRYGASPVSDAERAGFRDPNPEEARDLPDWIWSAFSASLGASAEQEAHLLRDRAEVFLRANLLRGSRETAQAALAIEGIMTEPCALSPTALRVGDGARRVHLSAAYKEGLVEFQDVASQAVVDFIAPAKGMKVLDYCAGGGGKALAVAAQTQAPVVAHDIDPGRMRDIPVRAERAGAKVVTDPAPRGQFDLVFCDAPCSGSGSWRRAPEAKWRLTPERLRELCTVQDDVLDKAAELVAADGILAYATCSLLTDENEKRVEAFQRRHAGWTLQRSRQFSLREGGDGFFVAVLNRDSLCGFST